MKGALRTVHRLRARGRRQEVQLACIGVEVSDKPSLHERADTLALVIGRNAFEIRLCRELGHAAFGRHAPEGLQHGWIVTRDAMDQEGVVVTQ